VLEEILPGALDLLLEGHEERVEGRLGWSARAVDGAGTTVAV
jgi:hypothetical protein